MRLHGTLVVALLVLFVVPPAAANAAPTWLAPVTLSAAGEENSPADVAVAPDGTAIAVWRRAVCTGSAEEYKCMEGRIQYSVRPPGGSFSAPVDMPGDPPVANIARPKVAVDGAGNAVAVWTSGTDATTRVRYAVRPAGSSFEAANTVFDELGTFHGFPEIAMASSGRAVVTFGRIVEAKNRVGYALRPPGGDFGAAQPIVGDPGGSLNEAAEVQMDDAGGAIATWTSSSPGAAIRYAVLAAGATEFDATQTLDPGASGALAMAPSGAA